MNIPWRQLNEDDRIEYEASVRADYLANLWRYDSNADPDYKGWILNIALWNGGNIKSLPQQQLGEIPESEALKIAEQEIEKAQTT